MTGVNTYSIGEIADRSGFSASALRYYEGIGLVEPATRTDAGYRVYDDHTLARLAFIARAKQLGCSLEEITDLVAIWDRERCHPVQRRFHDLVTNKIADAQAQIAELAQLTTQLQSAAAHLAGPAVDGPCDDSCACVTEPGRGAVAMVALTAQPEAPPVACTLDAGSMPGRLADWHAVLAHVRARSTEPDGALRIEFDDAVALAGLATMVAAEQQCCAFFSFAITLDHRGVALEVRAPEGTEAIVTALFGDPA